MTKKIQMTRQAQMTRNQKLTEIGETTNGNNIEVELNDIELSSNY